MQRSKLLKFVPFLFFFALLLSGPTLEVAPCHAEGDAASAPKQDENVYKGKVIGVSNKAKTISIESDGKTQMVKFDDNTEGMDYAKTGEAAIIKFEMRGKDKVATVIKPKLAKLPEGVAEMQVDELVKLVALGPEKGNYFLVDSRPGPRYDEGHIPSAVSIPVPKLEETKDALFPGDAKIKETLLIFYCGGPT